MKKEIIYWIKRIKTYFLVLFYALAGKFHNGTVMKECTFINAKIKGDLIIFVNCDFENSIIEKECKTT